MPTPVFSDEDIPYDPDTLKVPESHAHRQACDVIGLAAVELLGPDYEVFRDMNWYPTDGGNAIAPDVFVLTAGIYRNQPEVEGAAPKSYRQDLTGGPPPAVSIEVPSHRDALVTVMTKIERCRGLGVPVYLVTIEGAPSVLRFDPVERTPQPWEERPIEELGGLSISFTATDARPSAMEVTLPDGTRARTDHDLLTARADAEADARRAEADARRAEADARQAEAETRAELEALRRRLGDTP